MAFATRYDALFRLLYPHTQSGKSKGYEASNYRGKNGERVISDWSPHNLRRLVISQMGAWVQYYCSTQNKGFCMMSNEIGFDKSLMSELHKRSSGEEVTDMLEILSKYKQFSDIEEIIFCGYSNKNLLGLDWNDKVQEKLTKNAKGVNVRDKLKSKFQRLVFVGYIDAPLENVKAVCQKGGEAYKIGIPAYECLERLGLGVVKFYVGDKDSCYTSYLFRVESYERDIDIKLLVSDAVMGYKNLKAEQESKKLKEYAKTHILREVHAQADNRYSKRVKNLLTFFGWVNNSVGVYEILNFYRIDGDVISDTKCKNYMAEFMDNYVDNSFSANDKRIWGILRSGKEDTEIQAESDGRLRSDFGINAQNLARWMTLSLCVGTDDYIDAVALLVRFATDWVVGYYSACFLDFGCSLPSGTYLSQKGATLCKNVLRFRGRQNVMFSGERLSQVVSDVTTEDINVSVVWKAFYAKLGEANEAYRRLGAIERELYSRGTVLQMMSEIMSVSSMSVTLKTVREKLLSCMHKGEDFDFGVLRTPNEDVNRLLSEMGKRLGMKQQNVPDDFKTDVIGWVDRSVEFMFVMLCTCVYIEFTERIKKRGSIFARVFTKSYLNKFGKSNLKYVGYMKTALNEYYIDYASNAFGLIDSGMVEVKDLGKCDKTYTEMVGVLKDLRDVMNVLMSEKEVN